MRDTMNAMTSALAPIPSSVMYDYQEARNLSTEDAARACTELSKFLEICARSDQPLSPSVAVDDVWHEFILHTQDYAEYCENTFNKMIHHHPVRTAPVDEIAESYQRTISLLLLHFGEIDNRLWPVETNGSGAVCHGGGCRDK